MTQPEREGEPARAEGPAAAKLSPAARRNGGNGRLADGLGWFSLALGGAEVAVPALVARNIGVPNTPENRLLLRVLGAREIASGLGILGRDRQAPWVWSRVAGDAMDLVLLGLALGSATSKRRQLGVATAAVAGVAALDVVAGKRQARHDASRAGFEHVTRSMTVNKPPAEVYGFWRNLENLPRFMKHLRSVTVTGPDRSHWVVQGPAGRSVEWDAEIVEERPGEFLAWRSLPGSQVDHSGWVSFRPAPGGRGTEVSLRLAYHPPAGRLGSAVAWLFGREPEQQLREDVRRFKQVIETGEIARSDASRGLLGMRRAQPGTAQPYPAFERGEER
ncbi:MAG TPA: SRPBCC family protein [Vicinamibacterales bacterium]|mgnify:CR=1 FL=1|nr:SRPBCC family protein [Acidobacteriota bacterium]HOC17475.1 SRPBCC family protein [Vicinamibacterales bacterium]